MAAAVGPSGKNDEYLLRLDAFLNDAVQKKNSHVSPATAMPSVTSEQYTGDTLTRTLASMTRTYQRHHHLYFLFGSGSNQHDQLLLQSATRSHNNAPSLVNEDEAHNLKEIILTVPKVVVEGAGRMPLTHPPRPICLYAGGGHSALLTEGGEFYLWGWNGMGQLGRCTSAATLLSNGTMRSSPCGTNAVVDSSVVGPVIVKPLANIKVEMAALGHGHTLLIEKDTHLLYAFGDDGRGQVRGKNARASMSGGVANDAHVIEATAPVILSRLKFTHVAAGLFHSAAITEEGELVTFGEQKYGQCLTNAVDEDGACKDLRWRPEDGSRLVKVSCGRRHTMVLDEYGRVWSMGSDNKYGQLGRRRSKQEVVDSEEKEQTLSRPLLVDGILGLKGSGCVDIDCGWSHNIATVIADDEVQSNGIVMYGWGRNDKAQLGSILDGKSYVDAPQLLHTQIGGKPICNVCCGGESIMASNIDGEIYGCGWNEHGNLSTGNTEDVQEFTEIEGAHKICAPPPHDVKSKNKNILMAAGGAHFLAMQCTP